MEGRKQRGRNKRWKRRQKERSPVRRKRRKSSKVKWTQEIYENRKERREECSTE